MFGSLLLYRIYYREIADKAIVEGRVICRAILGL